jgi:hypothetical protein
VACEDNRAPLQTLSPQLLTGYDTPDDLDQNAATMSDHDPKGAATAASGGAGGAPAATPAMGFGSQLRVFGYAFPEDALEDLRGSVQTLRSNAQLYKDMPEEIRRQVDAVVAGDSARNVADELAAAAPGPATNESASRLVEQLQSVQAELREAEELRDEVEAERDRVEGSIADTEGQVAARQKPAATDRPEEAARRVSDLIRVCQLAAGTSPPPPHTTSEDGARAATADGAPRASELSRASSAEELRAAAENHFRAATRKKRQPTARKRRATRQHQADQTAEAEGDEAFVTKIGAERLSTWQMLYCGGSQPVVEALQSVRRRYGVKLRVEKFDW